VSHPPNDNKVSSSTRVVLSPAVGLIHVRSLLARTWLVEEAKLDKLSTIARGPVVPAPHPLDRARAVVAVRVVAHGVGLVAQRAGRAGALRNHTGVSPVHVWQGWRKNKAKGEF